MVENARQSVRRLSPVLFMLEIPIPLAIHSVQPSAVTQQIQQDFGVQVRGGQTQCFPESRDTTWTHSRGLHEKTLLFPPNQISGFHPGSWPPVLCRSCEGKFLGLAMIVLMQKYGLDAVSLKWNLYALLAFVFQEVVQAAGVGNLDLQGNSIELGKEKGMPRAWRAKHAGRFSSHRPQVKPRSSDLGRFAEGN